MRLALALGRTRDEVLGMSVDELNHWIALIELDGPFIPQRLDLLNAMNCHATVAPYAKSKVTDWLPSWNRAKPQMVDFRTGMELFIAQCSGKHK